MTEYQGCEVETEHEMRVHTPRFHQPNSGDNKVYFSVKSDQLRWISTTHLAGLDNMLCVLGKSISVKALPCNE